MTTLLLNNLLMINLRVSGINKKNPSASEMKPGIIKKKAAIAILAPEIISKIGNLF